MMPHDFLRNGTYFTKVDHLEHHADQFFHGCQNIAWDVAGFSVEFDLTDKDLVSLTKMISESDRFISKRLPFFTIAYLSFRLGYISMAADSLAGSSEELRFRDRQLKLKAKLEQEMLKI